MPELHDAEWFVGQYHKQPYRPAWVDITWSQKLLSRLLLIVMGMSVLGVALILIAIGGR